MSLPPDIVLSGALSRALSVDERNDVKIFVRVLLHTFVAYVVQLMWEFHSSKSHVYCQFYPSGGTQVDFPPFDSLI